MRAIFSVVGTLALSIAALATPTFVVLTPTEGGGAAGVGVSAAISRDGSSIMVPGSWTGGSGTMLYNKTGWHLVPNVTGFGISGSGAAMDGIYETSDNYFFYNGSVITITGTINGGGILGMSANGLYGVGQFDYYPAQDEGYSWATVCTPGSNTIQFLNHPAGRANADDTAWACSSDASHIVGWSYKDDDNDGLIPIEWIDGAAASLPLISGTTYGAALAINDQGNMLFGFNGSHIVLYTNGVPQDLGANQAVPDTLRAETSMSNDGNVLLFHGAAAVYPSFYEVWTPQTGYMDAYKFLVAQGVKFGTYTIYNVYSVSADGTKYAGLVWNADKSLLLPFIATIDPLVPIEKTFSINPSIIGGNNLSGVIGLTAASKGRFRAVISSSDNLVSGVPILNANTTVEDFIVPTAGVAKETAETVDATIGGTTLSQTINLLPAVFTSMNFNTNSIAGGNNVLCAAHFNGNTPTTGGTLALKSSIPTVAVVPATCTLAKNYPYSEFTIVTKPVATTQSPVITITYGGVTKTETLTVVPAALSAIVSVEASVKGGAAASLKITLTGEATSAGIKVALKSSNAALASVTTPATVVSGASSVVAPVTTKAVTANTVITFTATYGTVTKTCTLTLTP
ncbi:MAG TPA: hypothetical protein VGL56_09040 [Fimbriimonadaceae bacterium]|jgi:hypothetical protein